MNTIANAATSFAVNAAPAIIIAPIDVTIGEAEMTGKIGKVNMKWTRDSGRSINLFFFCISIKIAEDGQTTVTTGHEIGSHRTAAVRQ